jgi:probable HAF family extracellular repeat protein
MKSILTSIAAGSLLVTLMIAQHANAQPSPRYTLTDLNPKGAPFSFGGFVNSYGLVAGAYGATGGAQHAAVWNNGLMFDISQPGLAGTNSLACCVNELGQVLMQGETTKDPNNENFCGYADGLICVAYLWQYGTITQLPTLGGSNAGYGGINNVGQVAGWAEKNTRDLGCSMISAVNGTGPQILDFEAVIWGPGPGQIRQLAPLPGDTVGLALWINDFGQAVGISGSCGNTILPGFTAGPHAVVWESDGSVHDLGDLGGTVNPAMLAVGNGALGINNRGQITGVSALKGNTTFHPFLWTREDGMRDLGVLPGDLVGAGLAINKKGEIVGASISAPGPASGNPRAFLWRNGVMNDLNDLVQPNAPLYLLQAFSINDAGEIAGIGATSAGDVHAFLATPIQGGAESAASESRRAIDPPVLGESARKLLFGWRGIRGQ